MTRHGYLGLVLIFLSSVVPLTAETDESLDEVVVTASRIERSVIEEYLSTYIIKRDKLGWAGAQTVGDALRWAPGVNISGGAPFAAASRSTVLLQGLPAQYGLILTDGQRTKGDHIHTGVNLELIPLSMIERIEVVRGPGSVVHGSDTLGGIVNIISRPAPEQPVSQVTTTYGSENTFNLGLVNGNRIKNLSYLVMANKGSSDGPDIGNDYDRNTARWKMSYHFDDNLKLTSNLFYYEGQYATSQDDMFTYNLGLDAKSDESGRLKASFEGATYDRTFKSGAATTDNRTSSGIVQYSRLIREQHYLITGGEVRRELFERLGTRRHYATVGSLYAQDEYNMADNFTLVLGARVDDHTQSGTEFSPRGGIHWRPGETSVRVSVAKGFRTPSVQDLYEYHYDHKTLWRDGNPDLKPETSLHYSAEVERKFMDEQLGLRTTLFRNNLEDMISLRNTGKIETDGDPVLERYNISKAHTQGIELGVLAQPSKLVKGFQMEAAYTFLKAEDDTTDDHLAYSPRHTYKGMISYHYGIFSIGLTSEYVTGRYYRDKNDLVARLDNYALTDINLACKISGQSDLSVSFKNVFDEEFMTYEEGKATSAYGRFNMVSYRVAF